MQGDEAAPAIAAAIKYFNTMDDVDVLIVGRGGGSMEDLWAFNEECVARAVFESAIPVISAVGHETDFTICDFVADMRAPTPSAAAELVMPVKQDVMLHLRQTEQRLTQALKKRLVSQRHHMQYLSQNSVFRRPLERVEKARLDLDHDVQDLGQAMRRRLTAHEHRISVLSGKLDALSPLKVLARGYGLVKTVPGDKTVFSAQKVTVGDQVDVWLSDGVLGCRVQQVRNSEVKTYES